MFEMLDAYLKIAAPHIYDLMSDALKAFDRVELPNYQDGYVDILMQVDSTTRENTIDAITELTAKLQSDVLWQHEVVLQNDATVTTGTLFINAIMDIQQYSDLETLLRTATISKDTNECFAEIVSLVSHVNTDELLTQIQKIGPALISTIIEMCEEKPVYLSAEETLVRQSCLDKFALYRNLSVENTAVVVELLDTGLDVGYPFKTYMCLIGDKLSEMKVSEIAGVLLSCALISSDGNNNPINIIQNTIDDYISDVNEVTSVMVAITGELLKLNTSNNSSTSANN